MLGKRRSTDGAPRRQRAVLATAIAVAALVAHVLVASGTAGATPSAAATQSATAAVANDPGAIEAEFVGLINNLRASRGLPTLEVDPELTSASRTWAANMERNGGIFHATDLSVGVTADWAKLGENVGEGNEIGPLFDAFVASPSHLKNLVDPSFTRVGVGVVVSPAGRIFTTHRFMALRPAPAPAPPPPPAEVALAPPPTQAPTTSTTSTTASTTVPPTTVAIQERPVGKLGPLQDLAALIAL